MKTVKSSFKLSGNGLMFAQPVEIEIQPSNQKGIRFHINNATIEADVDNVVSTEHCVVVADVKNGAQNKIALIEHFMAACAVAEIDALDVYFNSEGFEMPIFDGSAKVWVQKFAEVGFDGEKEKINPLDGVVMYQKENSSVIIAPNAKENGENPHLRPTTITYCVNYNHPDLKNRWATLEISKNIGEIVEARTFGYLNDLEKLQAAGYSKGVTIENTLGLKDDGTYTSALRSEYEPIKHKILDIIGDLYLTGYNPLRLNANIIVKEAGHGIHHHCAKVLKKVLDENNSNIQ